MLQFLSINFSSIISSCIKFSEIIYLLFVYKLKYTSYLSVKKKEKLPRLSSLIKYSITFKSRSYWYYTLSGLDKSRSSSTFLAFWYLLYKITEINGKFCKVSTEWLISILLSDYQTFKSRKDCHNFFHWSNTHDVCSLTTYVR